MSVNIPTYQDAVAGTNPAGAPQRLTQDVANLAPLATSYHAPQPVDYGTYKAPVPTGSGFLPTVTHFLGAAGTEVGHMAAGAVSWLAKNTVQMVESPFKFTYDITRGTIDTYSQNHQINQLLQQQQNLSAQWRAGQISNAQFQSGLKDITSRNKSLSDAITANGVRLQNSKQEGINTAATLVTIATAGIAGIASPEVATAGKYLASANATAFLGNVESGLSRIATNPELFAKLSPAAQKALQTATAEVVANGANMTAAQIARGTAVNVALKYPIYYNYLSSTGTQLYRELDQAKYGAAVRTTAFNAALLLSGGPIGYALKYLGRGVKATLGATFGQTSFIDELSKFIGNGDPQGLYQALSKMPEAERAEAIKQLSAVEATNLGAVGKDPLAAAMRVIKGMESYEGISMNQFSHEEALTNMVNFAKAQRLADDAGKTAGLGPVTVGRVDSRALNEISTKLSTVEDMGFGVNKPNVPEVPKELPQLDPKRFDASYGKGVGSEGQMYFGGIAKSAEPIASKMDLQKVGAFAQASNDVKVRRDARQIIYQLSDRVDPKTRLQKMQELNANLESRGTPEGAHLEAELNKVAPLSAMQRGQLAAEVTQPTQGASGVVQQRLDAWEKMKAQNPTQAWANNENFDRQVKALISKYPNEAELDSAIKSIKASFVVDGFPKSVAKQLSKMGYIPIKPVNLEAPFAEGSGKVASKFAQNNNFFIKAVQPLPILKQIGAMFSGMGLSPTASTQRVYQIFNDNLAKNLQETGIVRNIAGEDAKQTTDSIIKQLSNYAKEPTRGKVMSHVPITDLRMLTTKDVQLALDVTKSDAATVQKAIAQSFLQVPLAVRGLGDRAVDVVYNLGATGAVQRRYLRLQGAARFSWNPFFQYLRVIPKTEILSSFEGGGFVNSVFKGQLGKLGEVRQFLKANNFLERQSGFTSTSDIATEFSGLSHNLNKQLLPMQERSIAGLINSQAERMGMDYKTYATQNPQAVRDTVQMIAEYDKRSTFLNSPLARTMNIAFFPFRFDTKVAMIMTKSLARTSLMTQVAVVNGMMQAHDWLNSAEGKAWYAANTEAIGLFKYVTPVASLNEVFHSLLPGNDHSLGNFGELGGLPFGWIPQLLDSEGLTQFNQPGADPKTGALYSDSIPVTSRGQVATAIQDFLSTLFSYPGATVGLPSKTKATGTVGKALTGATTSDFRKVNESSNPEQQAYQNDLGTGLQPNMSAANAAPTAVPVIGTPNVNLPAKPVKSGGSARKKKSDYTPVLLPGQSSLGVIPGQR